MSEGAEEKGSRSGVNGVDATMPQLGHATPRTPVGMVTPAGISSGNGDRGGPFSYRTGDLVAERYKIVRAIGEGGMGEVYEADDLLLRERVALKTLRDPVANDETTLLRFKREIQLARKVTHPNVCRLFDVGIDRRGGRESAFLTMELLIGETLSARLRQVGRMAPAEALPLVEQIAAALQAAHEAGIIHRDLKCANVLLVETHGVTRAVVTDFGLARVIAEGADQVTGDGGVVGSPAYMAPEQVEGGRRLTAAADIYALGVVMFEMVTGRLPFIGETPLATAVKRIKEAPPAPKSFVTGLDSRWDATILHCLVRAPEGRPPTALDVVRGLRGQLPHAGRVVRPWVVAGVVVASVAALVAIFAARGGGQERTATKFVSPEPPEPPDLTSLSDRASRLRIILPPSAIAAMEKGAAQSERAAAEIRRALEGEWGGHFEDMSGKPGGRRSVAILGFKNLGKADARYISTAVAEMLSTELMAGEELRTVPGESVARAKRQLQLIDQESYAADTLATLRSILHSDYVVTGSYFVFGDHKIRLDLKLQDTRTGELRASFAESGTEDDLTDLVSDAGERLRDALDIEPASDSERAGARALLPRKADAARQYGEGIAQLRVQNCSAARGPLEEAVATDPHFAVAHTALSEALSCLGYDTRALEEARTAVELAKDLPIEMRLNAEAHFQNLTGDIEKALVSHLELYRRFPDNFDYGVRVVREQMGTGDLSGARKTLAALRRLPTPLGDSPELDLFEADLVEDAKPEERLATIRRAKAKAEQDGARLVVATALLYEHKVLRNLARLDEAQTVARSAREIFEAAGDRDGIIQALANEAAIHQLRGETAQVNRLLEQATALGKDLDSVRSLAGFHSGVAENAFHAGDPRMAQRELEKALELFVEHRSRGDAGRIYVMLARLALSQGDLRAAAHHLGLADREYGESNRKYGIAMVRFANAQLAVMRGDLAMARVLAREAANTWPQLVANGGDQVIEGQIALVDRRYADAETAARKIIPGREMWTFPLERSRILIEALLEQGKVADAQAEFERTRARLEPGKASALDYSLQMELFAAQIRAASRRPAEVKAAIATLVGIAQRAEGAGFFLIAKVADLTRGRLLAANRNVAGRALLAELEKDAVRRGLVTLAEHARAAQTDGL